MDNPESPEAMGATEIAHEIGISKVTVIADIRAGILPATKVGNTYTVRPEIAEDYISVRRAHLELQQAAAAALAGLRKAMQDRADQRTRTKKTPRARRA